MIPYILILQVSVFSTISIPIPGQYGSVGDTKSKIESISVTSQRFDDEAACNRVRDRYNNTSAKTILTMAECWPAKSR